MSLFSKIFGQRTRPGESTSAGFELDYEQMVLLDAENLAEQGIGDAYAKLIPRLREHVGQPVELSERIDSNVGSYFVSFGGTEHVVYSPDVPGSEEESWGRATSIFFQLVNSQLEQCPVRFYAINGGNDLGGMFLTDADVESARKSLPRKSDWPYTPDIDDPDYGQFLDRPRGVA